MVSSRKTLIILRLPCFVYLYCFIVVVVQCKINSYVSNFENNLHPGLHVTPKLKQPTNGCFSWRPHLIGKKMCTISEESFKAKYILLSKFPKIHFYRNCISEKQRKELLNLATKRLTSETNSGFSSSLYLRTKQDAKLEILKDIAKIAGRMSGLPWEHAEPISLTKYTLKQNYGLHYDSGFTMNGKSTNRVATFLLYLNDVKEGGETVFPFATNETDFTEQIQPDKKPIQEVCRREHVVKVAPISGSCIVFYNHLDGVPEVDPLSLHGSCPVLSGEKWIAQIWLHGRQWQNEMDTFWQH